MLLNRAGLIMSTIIFVISFIILPSYSIAAVFNVRNEDELRQALSMAGPDGEDFVINIAAGVYHNFGMPFVYTDTGGDGFNLTIQGEGTDTTILDGDGISRVLEITSGADPSVFTIKGLTIQNGFIEILDEQELDGYHEDGAGILISCGSESVIIIEDCEFIDNRALHESSSGGAIYVVSNNELYLRGNIVSDNSAGDNGGGAWIYGRNIEIMNNFFIDNQGVSTGGGVRIEGLNLILANNDFIHNNAELVGGGVHANIGDTAIINNNNFLGNNSEAFGGGLSIDSSNVEIVNNKFTENTARLSGGGAEIGSDSESIITGNMFTANSVYLTPTEPDTGGGGLSIFIRDKDVVMTNNVFNQNTSTGNGGALDVAFYEDFVNRPVQQNLPEQLPRPTFPPPNTPEDKLVLTNNTFTLNSALLNGGAINVIDSFTDNNTLDIYNNIVYDNMADEDGDDIYIKGGSVDSNIRLQINLFNNDFSDLFITCVNSNGCLPELNEGNNIDENPLFVDAESGDVSVEPGSPCIDAGDPNAPDLQTKDIFGNPRVPPPDIGAVEFIEIVVDGEAGGGCSIAHSPVTSSLAVFLALPVLILLRRIFKRQRT